MQKVDQLYVLLGADAKPLKAAMRDAERAVQHAQRRSTGHLKQMDSAFSSVSRAANGAIKAMGPAAVAAIGGFFAVATVRAFNREVEQAIAKLDNIAKTADRIGISTDALQEWRHAAELSGLQASEFDKGVEKFARALSEARDGVAEYKDSFDALGIALRDGNGELRGQEELLSEVGDALKAVEDPANRTRLAIDLFGRSGAKMINLFLEGSVAINKMRQDARDLGIVFDEALIRKSVESKDKLDTLWKVIDADVTRTFADMADELVQIVKILADFVKWVTKATAELLKFFGIIDRNAMDALVTRRENLQAQLRQMSLGGPYTGLYGDPAKIRAEIAAIDEQINRLNVLNAARRGGAGTPGGAGAGGGGGGGGGSGKATRDPLAELARNMEAQRRVFETLSMTAEMPSYSGMTDQVKLATEVVEQLGAAGLNLSERFKNGFGGATDQVLAWMGLLDQANISVGDLTDRERELGERIAQEALWREELKQQYEEFLTLRERDKELTTGLEEFDEAMAQSDQFDQELARLEEQYEKRLELLKDARDRELQTEEEFQKRRAALEADHAQKQKDVENDRYALMLRGASSTFGQIASVTRQFAGEQSGIYRAMFFTSKALAIAEAVLSIQGAMAKALDEEFPANLIHMATVAAQGASILGTITSVTAGFAQGGMVRGPGTATSDSIPARLSSGEFVVNAAAAAQHRGLLEAINAGMPALPAVPRMGTAAMPGAVPPVQFNIVNEIGHLGRAEVDPNRPNTVRIRAIAREEVFANAGDAAARDLRDPDSDFSKALGGFTTARRDR